MEPLKHLWIQILKIKCMLWFLIQFTENSANNEIMFLNIFLFEIGYKFDTWGFSLDYQWL